MIMTKTKDTGKISLFEAARLFTDKHCKGVGISGKYCKGCIYNAKGYCTHPEWMKLRTRIKGSKL